MPALIRKELRELLLPLAIGVVVLLLVVVIGSRYPGFPGRLQWVLALWWLGTPLLAMVLGAEAVAKERSRRTTEWQGVWPVSRLKWWLTKLGVYLAVLAAAYSLTAGLAWGELSALLVSPHDPAELRMVTILVAALSLLCFAVGVFYSTIRRSPFEAFGMALLTIILFGVGWVIAMGDLLPRNYGPRLGLSLATLRPWANFGIGAVCGLIALTAAAWTASSLPVLAFARRGWRAAAAAMVLSGVGIPALLACGLYLSPRETPDLWALAGPALSPDGRLVAFMDGKSDEFVHGGLWVVGADGTGLRCVARGPVYQFQWLPDSRRVAVEWGYHGGDSLLRHSVETGWWWLADSQTRRLRRLPMRDTRNVFISPRGTYMVGGDTIVDLRTARVVGTTPVPVTDASRAEPRRWALFENWAWAEDESALYHPEAPPPASDFRVQQRCGVDRIAIPSGGMTRRVFVALSTGFIDRPVQPGGWVLETSRRAVVPGHADRQGLRAEYTIAARLDGTSAATFPGLDTFEKPVSPDARYLWLHDRRHWVAVADLCTGKIIARLGGPGPLPSISRHGPYWSPDGNWVAFVEQPPEEKPTRLVRPRADNWVHITSADGSAPLRTLPLARTDNDSPVVGWTPDDQLVLNYRKRGLIKLSPDGRETVLLQAASPGRWAQR